MTESELHKKRAEALSAARKRVVRRLILGVVGVGIFLGVWIAITRFELIDRRLIATPWETILELIRKNYDHRPDGQFLITHIGASLVVALSGFGLAVLVGVPLGLLMGWYRLIDRFVGPVFEILRPLPPIAWIPFTVIFLGIGLFAKSAIIFLSAFIPSLINSYTGIRLTNQVYINVSTTCGASRWTTFWRIGIPSALPMIFAGIRISLGNAWSTLVAAEMLASNRGLGYMIIMGRNFYRVDLIIAGMLAIGILGILFTTLFERIEKRVLKWRTVK
ncbi:MAG: ABC transporter permease [Planctomycetes bacterium]|nr:ABC transporter permease [Planctomycetota bacterium]